MTRTLDDDLAAAAPPVRERTHELRAALRELIGDTEQQTRQEVAGTSPRKRTIAAVALATLALLGTGTTAAAAGWIPTSWWETPDATRQPATSSAGTECSVTYAPRAFVDAAHPVSDTDRAAAMSAARDFLRRFDYVTIADTSHRTQFETLNVRLTQALRRQGLSTHAVSVALASDCPDGAEQ